MDWGIGKMPIYSAFLVTRIEMDFSKHSDITSCPSDNIFKRVLPLQSLIQWELNENDTKHI